MIIVSNTSPLCYLTLIGHAEVMPKLYGTLGVLCDAAQAGLLKLPAALDLLRKTNFRASPELWRSLYTR